MLHILLFILKIIGIVLLAALGLLLAALLLVLLVPVRYRLDGSWHGSPAGKVRVTWLLHAVSVLVSYENGLEIGAKLLGFSVFRTASGEGDAEESGAEEDRDGSGIEDRDESGAESRGEADGWDDDEFVEATSVGDAASREITSADDGEFIEATSAGADDLVEITSAEERKHRVAEMESDAPSVNGASDNSMSENGADALSDIEGERNQSEEEDDSDDIFDRIENIISAVGDKLEWADQKRRWVGHFLEDPKNRKTIRLVWRQATAILRHILPQKANGQVTFGFDDPATTGKVLAACSVLYALYGTQFTITPDFENAVIDGDLQLKGRIRIGTLAARAVRVLIDRNLWRMIKKVRKFLGNGGK